MESNSYIQEIFDERKDFIIIATTGKARSKVRDVCKLLVSKHLPDNATQPADTSQFEDSEIREFKVVYRYLHHNWKPFIEINVTNVMLSYLLEADIEKLMQEESGLEDKSLYGEKYQKLNTDAQKREIGYWEAVKNYVKFYSFLYIIKVAGIIRNQRKELKEYGKYFTSI